ncbi:hypothetical protein [Brachybacterium tyrofermentans]|uniref:hypothetical protein n=1 Tax=Brachybacterium tyrofermentans TaxID=47848 RepID=UPI001868D988|nr:hypothetical protein [Brachybacterium tyrofermentans]
MPNDDPQSTDGQQQQSAEAQQQSSQQQNDGQEAQNSGQDRSGEQGSTPTPREVHERAQSDSGVTEAQTVEELPDWAQRELRRGRDDSGRYRSERDAAKTEADERVQAILKAAGIEPDEGSNEDPVQAAAAAREQAEADARAARVELAVFRAAPGKNADPARLLNTNSFHERVKGLDPTDSDALAAAIEDEVKTNPYLASTQAAARSSADFTGGDGDGAITQEKFRDMTMQQRNELYASDPDTYRRLAASK